MRREKNPVRLLLGSRSFQVDYRSKNGRIASPAKAAYAIVKGPGLDRGGFVVSLTRISRSVERRIAKVSRELQKRLKEIAAVKLQAQRAKAAKERRLARERAVRDELLALRLVQLDGLKRQIAELESLRQEAAQIEQFYEGFLQAIAKPPKPSRAEREEEREERREERRRERREERREEREERRPPARKKVPALRFDGEPVIEVKDLIKPQIDPLKRAEENEQARGFASRAGDDTGIGKKFTIEKATFAIADESKPVLTYENRLSVLDRLPSQVEAAVRAFVEKHHGTAEGSYITRFGGQWVGPSTADTPSGFGGMRVRAPKEASIEEHVRRVMFEIAQACEQFGERNRFVQYLRSQAYSGFRVESFSVEVVTDFGGSE